MGRQGGDLPSLIISNRFDINLGKLYPRVEHLPLFAKVSHKQPKVPQLYGIHDDRLRILLRPHKFVDTHYPPDIIDITKNDDIVLQTVLLSYLSVQLIHIDFVIQTMTDFDQVVRSRLLTHVLLAVV